ncbi:MAG: hypothetical protein NZ921_00745, partial [Candidatus Caldarchaeum sp.]|nr:hypothetical protein [Candidatus Caldarchaeum sp.]
AAGVYILTNPHTKPTKESVKPPPTNTTTSTKKASPKLNTKNFTKLPTTKHRDNNSPGGI